jgi:hemerythrin-like metal-binding protein
MNSTNENVPSSWNNSYSLNIPMIDKQHINFFRMFDKLLLLNQAFKINNEEIKELIDELDKYTHVHFKTEEELMRKANASDYEQHLIQHGIFINKVEEFKTAYNYGNSVLLDQMVAFMRKWFLMHISEVDSKYAETVQHYMAQKGWEIEEE